MKLREIIERWLRDRQRDGCKPSTMRVYHQRTKTLLAELGDVAAADVTRNQLLDWLDRETHWSDDHKDASKRGKRKANDTVRLIVTTLRMIEEFAVDREYLEKPWLKKRDAKKPPALRRERLPSPEETEQILAAAKPDFAAIYKALRNTGARPAELCNAQIEHIHTEDGRRTLIVSDHKTARKSGRDRKIPLGPDVAELFDAAIAGRTEGHIFLRKDGQPWKRSAVTSTFRTIRRKLGLDERLVPYCCRHEFITAVTRRHGISRAKVLAGHASITTTQRYDHPTDEEIHQSQAGIYES